MKGTGRVQQSWELARGGQPTPAEPPSSPAVSASLPFCGCPRSITLGRGEGGREAGRDGGWAGTSDVILTNYEQWET